MWYLKNKILKSLLSLWVAPNGKSPESATKVTAEMLLEHLPKRYQNNRSKFDRAVRMLMMQDLITFVPELNGYIITAKGLDYLEYWRKKFWTIFSFVVGTAVSSAISIVIGYLIGIYLK